MPRGEKLKKILAALGGAVNNAPISAFDFMGAEVEPGENRGVGGILANLGGAVARGRIGSAQFKQKQAALESEAGLREAQRRKAESDIPTEEERAADLEYRKAQTRARDTSSKVALIKSEIAKTKEPFELDLLEARAKGIMADIENDLAVLRLKGDQVEINQKELERKAARDTWQEAIAKKDLARKERETTANVGLKGALTAESQKRVPYIEAQIGRTLQGTEESKARTETLIPVQAENLKSQTDARRQKLDQSLKGLTSQQIDSAVRSKRISKAEGRTIGQASGQLPTFSSDNMGILETILTKITRRKPEIVPTSGDPKQVPSGGKQKVKVVNEAGQGGTLEGTEDEIAKWLSENPKRRRQ